MPAALSPEVRDHLLDAADRLLADGGYGAMTVELLAREAGIGKGSVYLLFPSKQEVALACIDRNADRIQASLAELAGAPGPAPRRLRAMLHLRILARFDYASSHSASLDTLLSAFRTELLARRARQFSREASLIARVLRQGVAAGEFVRVSPRATAEALVSATNALLPFSLSAAELGHRRAVAAGAERIIRLLLAGLVPAGPPSRR
jgi:TetR/AcrR family transcriptional regulator